MAIVVVVIVVIVVLLLGLSLAGIIPRFLPSSSSSSKPSGPSYDVTFSENGLPADTSWSVTLGGSTQSSTSSIVFSEKNGTYAFSVGPVSGYAPSPATGNVTVNGALQSKTITFSNTSAKLLGSAFSWETPVNATGSTPPGCAATTGHFCYTIGIAAAGNGVSTSNVLLSLHSPTGTTIAWPASISAISLVSLVGAVLATYSIATNSWTLIGTFGGALAAGMTIAIYTTGGPGLLGDSLVATGANGFSGTVTSTPFS